MLLLYGGWLKNNGLKYQSNVEFDPKTTKNARNWLHRQATRQQIVSWILTGEDQKKGTDELHILQLISPLDNIQSLKLDQMD